MNFEYTEEQRMLADTIDRFVADRYNFESRLQILHSDEGWSREAWCALAELGLLGLPFSEEDGGFGGSGVETMIVMKALGRGLVLEPWLTTVIMAGSALRFAGSKAQKAARIEPIISGEHIMSLAHQEPGGLRHSLAARTLAKRTGNGWLLDGSKISVPHGTIADEVVVSAGTDEGQVLLMVPITAAGVSSTPRTSYDGIPLADLDFDDVELPADVALCQPGEGEAILERVFDETRAALVAEAWGAMQEIFDLTTDYLRTRTQFDVAIGTFQALRHRVVDMLIELEQSQSMAILAALSLDLPAQKRRANISAAKVQIGHSGRIIGQEAVQMHGAIGITAEYKIGHAFKRLTAIDAQLGDVDHHLDLLVELGGLFLD